MKYTKYRKYKTQSINVQYELIKNIRWLLEAYTYFNKQRLI